MKKEEVYQLLDLAKGNGEFLELSLSLQGDKKQAFIHTVEDLMNDPEKILKFNEIIHELYIQNEIYLESPSDVLWLKENIGRLYIEVMNIITLHQPDQVEGFVSEADLLVEVYDDYEFYNYLWDIRNLFLDCDDFYIGEKIEFPTR